jgi:hypothetical protein
MTTRRPKILDTSREVVCLHKLHQVFPISLCVTPIMISSTECGVATAAAAPAAAAHLSREARCIPCCTGVQCCRTGACSRLRPPNARQAWQQGADFALQGLARLRTRGQACLAFLTCSDRVLFGCAEAPGGRHLQGHSLLHSHRCDGLINPCFLYIYEKLYLKTRVAAPGHVCLEMLQRFVFTSRISPVQLLVWRHAARLNESACLHHAPLCPCGPAPQHTQDAESTHGCSYDALIISHVWA